MPSYEPVTALTRGLQVLEAVAAERAATIKSLHAATGIPKPTLVRIVETLIHAGYLASSGGSSSYVLTARPLMLSGGVNDVQRLAATAAPLLTEFRTAVQWPSDLAVLDRDAMVILETSRQPGQLSINRQIGSRVPATRTALGRAFLAHLPADRRSACITALRAATGEPPDAAAFEALLSKVRARGYAWSDREHQPDIRALAAPVFSRSEVVASVNVIVIAAAMSLAELEERYAGRLIDLAARVTAGLDKEALERPAGRRAAVLAASPARGPSRRTASTAAART